MIQNIFLTVWALDFASTLQMHLSLGILTRWCFMSQMRVRNCGGGGRVLGMILREVGVLSEFGVTEYILKRQRAYLMQFTLGGAVC